MFDTVATRYPSIKQYIDSGISFVPDTDSPEVFHCDVKVHGPNAMCVCPIDSVVNVGDILVIESNI